ncbi:MAG: MBL fold metallo-hydrolase [Candidatus Thermoplasmatota archaeon]|nr:MBL fold metallo-hydrolase [Candidatus Thermoplasmatota archaeon]
MRELKKFVVGPLNTNLYLLISGSEAVIIDPGEMSAELAEYVKNQRIIIKYALATHGHFDHINGAGRVCELFGCRFFIHEKDAHMVDKNPESMEALIGIRGETITDLKTFSDRTEFRFGDEKIKVMETPGHTHGSTCFVSQELMFSGDTLFRGTVGRTDIGGSGREMARTLKMIMSMGENLRIYPGHGPETMLDHEKKTNQFMLNPDLAL